MSKVTFGYNNIFETGTVTASTEATGYPKENAYDWLTYDFWKPTVVNATLTVDAGADVTVDYFAVAAHDLYTNGASIKLQYSTDNFAADINDAFALMTPTSNGVIFKIFTAQTKRYWRVVMTGAVSKLGVVAAGSKLDMGAGAQFGYTPPTLSFDDDVTNHRSRGGAFIGRSLRRKGASGSLKFKRLTAAWVRSNWEPFLQHARTKPFFLSWDESNYPDDAAYCWTDKKIRPPVYPQAGYMDVSLDYKALTE